MNQRLNDQLNRELTASYAYLAMACTLNQMGLKVMAEFFTRQSSEEREHAEKFLKYIQEVDGAVTLAAVAAPSENHTTALAIAKASLESELAITGNINDLVTLAESEKDYATRQFLAWFVEEQVEEISSMGDLLRLIQMAKGNMLQVEARIRHEMAAPK